MKEDKYQFLETMGHVDEQLIYQSSQPWKKHGRNRIRIFSAGKEAACAALVIALGATCVFHQQAEAMISSFTTGIARILGIEDDLTPYAEIIHTSQTKEGITVTLEEVILGENELYASVHLDWDDSVELEEGMMDPGIGLGCDLKINGEELATVSCGNMGDGEPEVCHDHLLSFIYGENILPDEIREVELEVRVFLTTEDEEEGIPFTYHFSVSGEELRNDTLHIPMDQKIKSDNGITFQFHELILNRVMSRIRVEHDDEEFQKIDDAEYLLLGTDSLGNQIEYELSGSEGRTLVFESIGDLPSVESQWVELQLYGADLKELEIPDQEESDSGETQTEKPWDDKEAEEYVEDSRIYEIDIHKFSPVGEKFRVEIKP